MKKLLAILLAAAMLCAFASVGAAALAPEEELQARGRVLLEETLAVFDSNNYTLRCDRGIYVQEGKRFATEDRQWTGSSLLKWLLGNELEIATPEQSLVAFRKWKCCFDSTSLMRLTGKDPGQFFNEVSNYFGSAAMLDSLPVNVVEENAYLVVTLGDPSADGGPVIRYYYLDGQLKRICGTPVPYSSYDVAVESLVPEADLSLFSTKGLLKLPSFLMLLFSIFEL